MGKKRKSKPMRPWCWYCEKDFEDDKVLVTHQRAKHFKCEECNKKLTTAGGMVVHSHQVHKIDIYKVPNALPGRDKLDIEIFGMEGIPEEDMIAHEARISGNHGNKKSKASGSGHYGELTLEQIQAQMAAHKAAAAAAVTSAEVTPTNTASPVITAPAVIQQPPQLQQQPPQQYYNYNAYYGQPAAGAYGQYYPPAPPNGYNAPPMPGGPVPPQNYGYAAPPPNAGYPGQWGYQGYPPGPPGPMPNVPPPHPMGAGVPPMPMPMATSAPPPPAAAANTDYVPAAATAPPQPAAVAPVPATTPPQQPLSATQSPPQPHLSENPMTPPLAAPTSTTPNMTPNGKKKPSKVVLIYNNNEISPEEQRARLEKHQVF
ncbi:C2H2 finger domain-containing protein [Mucor ambiguus]|uniref:C2H2 finger domain-containing protein n=1 Tax=Mucor ambiguus TaxID=91626 RepID=A0A0C9MH59_9FUNG|nr:C2H2 finger domain-containing protein [Mucor ambiguus]